MTSQFSPDGRLRHLLSLDGLNGKTITSLLDQAQALRANALGGTALRDTLAGKTVCTLFFEPSTRTRSSFQLAAQRLGADMLAFDVLASSAKKGESALDTLRNLEAMGVDAFVVRLAEDGAAAALAAGAKPGTVVINGGDGRSNHPTQGLLDMLTLRQRKGADFSRLKVLIVGHTDSDGDDATNMDLSRRRAASVKAALASEFKIDASRMDTDGKGESQPIDKNDNAAGKANNRRVEFIKK